MAGVQFIEHAARRVLLISMANCSQEQALAIMDEAMRLIKTHPPKSLITITQVEGMHYSPVTVKAVQDFARHNEPWVSIGIVVGVSGVRKVVFESVVRLTGRRLFAFETMDEAKQWLGKHATGESRTHDEVGKPAAK